MMKNAMNDDNKVIELNKAKPNFDHKKKEKKLRALNKAFEKFLPTKSVTKKKKVRKKKKR